MSEAFVWNLIFVGNVLANYASKYQNLSVDWSIPDGDLDAILILVGTTDCPALERKYLKYYDIEELDPFSLKEKIENMLNTMVRKVLPL
jgi:hypothetical protein